jgi:hypothetical protein
LLQLINRSRRVQKSTSESRDDSIHHHLLIHIHFVLIQHLSFTLYEPAQPRPQSTHQTAATHPTHPGPDLRPRRPPRSPPIPHHHVLTRRGHGDRRCYDVQWYRPEWGVTMEAACGDEVLCPGCVGQDSDSDFYFCLGYMRLSHSAASSIHR